MATVLLGVLLGVLLFGLPPGEAAADPLPAADEHRVDLGSHRLHAVVRGSGTPVLVFDTGMGDAQEAWGDLPAALAELTTVVTYDRAGLGGSEAGPEPRDAIAVTDDLRALLQALELDPPWILVGHSLGGLHISVFADRFPHEVAGLVFLDPTTKGMLQSVLTEEGQADVMRQLEGESEGLLAEARGVPARVRRLAECGPPPDVPAVVVSAAAPPVLPEEMREEAAAAGVTQERLDELHRLKLSLHAELAAGFPRGGHRRVDDAHHYVHLDRPELVRDEIAAVVSRICASLAPGAASPGVLQPMDRGRSQVRQRPPVSGDNGSMKTATGTFEVELRPLDPYNQDPEAKIGRMSIDKTLAGDLVATGKGEMVSGGSPAEGSAGYVAMERITGTLHGRAGSFLLQHSATMTPETQQATITVVPGSGTGELSGLAGTFVIRIEDGAHFYDFEYSLPSSSD